MSGCRSAASRFAKWAAPCVLTSMRSLSGRSARMFHVPEKYRMGAGPWGSDSTAGNNGAFALPPRIGNRQLAIIASDGSGWEHVSVHCFAGGGQKAMDAHLGGNGIRERHVLG